MDAIEWGKIVAGVIGGGLVTKFFDYKLGSKKQEHGELESVIRYYKGALKELRDEVLLLKKGQDELREENRSLRTSLLMFERSHSDLPLPMWLKAKDGRLTYANRYYEQRYLEPLGKSLDDYLGRDDYSIYRDDIASAFRRNDNEVVSFGSAKRFVETIIDKDGNTVWLEVLKYPSYVGNDVIGISGVVLRESYNKIEL